MTCSDPTGGERVEPSLHEDPLTLYERAPCGYLSTTPDGTIVRVNQTFLAWTGYTEAELVGRRTFASLLSAGGRIYHDTHYAPMLRMQGAVREIAVDVLRSDRSRLPVLVNAALQQDDEGRPQVVRVVLLDATERRRYEQELLVAKRRAEESETRARSLAWTLQQTLIPPTLPQIPGLDIGAVYRPAGSGEEVGGDFYDVFEVGTGDWVVTLGDVCGKGVDAAVVTTLVRHTLRAVSVRFGRPVAALQALNEVLLHHPSERFCTLALLRLRRTAEGWRLAMALGGHPPALHSTAGGPWAAFGEPGSLVGALAAPEFAESTLVLEPGSTLVLYTDGVTEARHRDEQYGEQRLREVLQRHSASAPAVGDRDGRQLAEDILLSVLDFQGGKARDDIAIVTISVPASPSGLPGEP
ncbi:MAG: phosphoserine phosphatase RsbU/P [Nocardioidaceae bacterium]|nr:phosphoserine phosphatase RsbU/P [Nocardioidaceae bacterium]